MTVSKRALEIFNKTHGGAEKAQSAKKDFSTYKPKSDFLKSKKKWLMAAGAAIVLVGGAISGRYAYLANQEKKAEAAKQAKIQEKAEEISKRCSAKTTDLKADDPNAIDPNSVLCHTKADIKRWTSIAKHHENAGNFKKAGLAYIELGNTKEVQAMIQNCKKSAIPDCEKELKNASDILADALEKSVSIKKK